MTLYYATFDRGDPPTNRAWLVPTALGNKTVPVRQITTTTYTEIGRWNDIGDYRQAGDADYTNFGGVSWCANRGPLNGVADPFPLNGSITYRLRYVPGGAATAPAAQVIGTPTQAHIDSGPGGGIACYQIGSGPGMTAAFGNPISNPGSPPSFHGGQWILEQQTPSAVIDTFPRANELVTGDRVFAWDTDLMRDAPASDATNWTTIPNWSATAAYAQGATVVDNNIVYRAINPISVPGQQTTYDELARWDIAGGSSNTPNRADYYQASGDFGQYATAWFANNTPAPGGTNLTQIGIGSDTYRLRVTGNSILTSNPEAIGTLTLASNVGANRRAIRIGSGTDMRAVFGSVDVGSGGGNLILERQGTGPGSNTAPGSDTTNWQVVPAPAWSPLTLYAQNDVVSSATLFYTANGEITVTGGIWFNHTAAATGNDFLLENGSALLLENGSRLLLENS